MIQWTRKRFRLFNLFDLFSRGKHISKRRQKEREKKEKGKRQAVKEKELFL